MAAHSGRTLTAAIVAAVDAALPANCPVYQARAPREAAPPYAVVHATNGTADGSVADQSDYSGAYQVTYVAIGPDQADAAADLVRAALVMSTPTVTGRAVDAIQLDYSLGATPDEDITLAGPATTEPLYVARDGYRVTTHAA